MKASTTPAPDYDYGILADVNLDLIRRASVAMQDVPFKDHLTEALYQPALFAWGQWEKSDKTASAESTRKGLAAINMQYLVNFAIFGRCPGERPRTFDCLLDTAQRIAQSPQALIAICEELAQSATPFEADTGGSGEREQVNVDPDVAAAQRNARKAGRFARIGETRKAWQALKPGTFADPTEAHVRDKYAKLLPQEKKPVPPELLEDVPDVEVAQISKKTFDQVMGTPLRRRAPGTLHDNYEHYHHLWRFGGGKALLAFFNAVLAGRVPPEVAEILTTLRAVMLYKDKERKQIRPIGIGEALRRTICRCLATQERELWAAFFTNSLPEDAESRRFAIEEAEEEAATAGNALEAARARGGRPCDTGWASRRRGGGT
jgi:hypothetical protein